MAQVFIDANFLFDLSERAPQKSRQLTGHHVFVSPLSYHILFFTYKYKVPQDEISKQKELLDMVSLTDNILSHALQGPTSDLEDNIQLHSAAEAECDYFLTSDDKLLKMKFFGKTQIASSLPD